MTSDGVIKGKNLIFKNVNSQPTLRMINFLITNFKNTGF